MVFTHPAFFGRQSLQHSKTISEEQQHSAGNSQPGHLQPSGTGRAAYRHCQTAGTHSHVLALGSTVDANPHIKITHGHGFLPALGQDGGLLPLPPLALTTPRAPAARSQDGHVRVATGQLAAETSLVQSITVPTCRSRAAMMHHRMGCGAKLCAAATDQDRIRAAGAHPRAGRGAAQRGLRPRPCCLLRLNSSARSLSVAPLFAQFLPPAPDLFHLHADKEPHSANATCMFDRRSGTSGRPAGVLGCQLGMFHRWCKTRAVLHCM